MKAKRFRIQNFRNIDDSGWILLDQVAAFVGRNESGKTKLIGHAKLAGQALMCFAAYNLVRMGSIGGWWDAHHV